jgi:hypothetical protein
MVGGLFYWPNVYVDGAVHSGPCCKSQVRYSTLHKRPNSEQGTRTVFYIFCTPKFTRFFSQVVNLFLLFFEPIFYQILRDKPLLNLFICIDFPCKMSHKTSRSTLKFVLIIHGCTLFCNNHSNRAVSKINIFSKDLKSVLTEKMQFKLPPKYLCMWVCSKFGNTKNVGM